MSAVDESRFLMTVDKMKEAKPYRNGCTWKIDDRNSDDGKYV